LEKEQLSFEEMAVHIGKVAVMIKDSNNV